MLRARNAILFRANQPGRPKGAVKRQIRVPGPSMGKPLALVTRDISPLMSAIVLAGGRQYVNGLTRPQCADNRASSFSWSLRELSNAAREERASPRLV